jgi:predicted metal-dependent hydrolase
MKTPVKSRFIFGTKKYDYEIVQSDRKTMSLTVRPNMRIIVRSPHNTSSEKIEKFLQKKWFWLNKTLEQFEKYDFKKFAKEYVSGESIYYLGKQYMIYFVSSSSDLCALTKTRLIVNTKSSIDDKTHNRYLIRKWLNEEVYDILPKRYRKITRKFGMQSAPSLQIKEMSKRWGSFVSVHKIVLNPKLIHTSLDCIDYVIIHELCHVTHPNHGDKFWKLLAKKCKNWLKIKEKLELTGCAINM